MNPDGAAAEDLALSHLVAHGCRLVSRNFRSRFGEIDLIVSHGPTLVFVEVRKRPRRDYGSAADSITAAKRQRIVATAQIYLARRRDDVPCRFDAVLVDGTGRIEWVRDAFGA
mgnify:CR=1 FL=1